MGLGSRSARRHQTVAAATAGQDPSLYWEFKPGQAVMTVDGFPGTIASVEDGPLGGTETYIVTLANGMGGGEYTASQLSATSETTASVHTAADDYPELGTVLVDRPDIAKNTVLAAKVASNPHGIETAPGVEPNDGDEPGVDEHGHLTWGGNSPGCRDTDEYSMFGQNDAVEKEARGEHHPHHQHGHPQRGQSHHHPLIHFSQAPAIHTRGWGYGGWGFGCGWGWPGCAGGGAGDIDGDFGLDDGGGDMGSEASRTAAMRCPKCGGDVTPKHSDDLGSVRTCDSCGADYSKRHAGLGDRGPKFREGDSVVDFRGERAKVVKVIPVDTPGKSHRVQVHYDGDPHPQNRHYYEDVFSHASQPEAEQALGDEINSMFADHPGHEYLTSNPTGPTKYSSKQFDPWSMLREAAADADFRFEVTAAWSDVRAKAKRLRSEGRVHVTLATEGYVVAEVKGDHHVYETGIQRLPGKQAVSGWSCGCKWGAYHWGAADDFSRFAGRMCSHALAVQYEAQSRGMFGRDVHADDSKPSWAPRRVVVKYDIDGDRNVRGPATQPPGFGRAASFSPASVLFAQAVRAGDDLGEITLAFRTAGLNAEGAMQQAVIAAVNDPWGEPVAEVPQVVGPTKPKDPNENPASAGWASAPDDEHWQSIAPGEGIDRQGALDDAVFEPELPKEAIAPLVAPLVRAVAPMVLDKAVKKVMPGGGDDNDGQQPAASAPGDPAHHSPDDNDWDALNFGRQAELHDEPEPALPTTDGGEDDDLTHESAVQHLDPGSNWATDPDDLEPESIGFAATGSVDDIVAQFQATAGAQALQAGGARALSENAEIAAMARQTLAKEALKDFTPAEQAAIINEGEGVKAANLDRLDIAGTHYEPLEAALAAVDDEADDDSWMS